MLHRVCGCNHHPFPREASIRCRWQGWLFSLEQSIAHPGVGSNRSADRYSGIVAGDREARMPDTQSYQAKELVCGECDEWFVFTAKEQRFYAEQGFPLPKRRITIVRLITCITSSRVFCGVLRVGTLCASGMPCTKCGQEQTRTV